MKKWIYVLMTACMAMVLSCQKTGAPDSGKDVPEKPELVEIRVLVELAEPDETVDLEGVDIRLTSGETQYEAKTDEKGSVAFQVPYGIYSVFATSRQTAGTDCCLLNGSKEEMVVDASWKSDVPVILKLVASRSNQVIIKELYVGGVIEPATSKNYLRDSYITLYNNSPVPANIPHLAMAIAPGASNKVSATMWGFIDYKGEQCYADEDWIPLQQAVWYFQDDLVIEPYSQVVVAIAGAINHQLTFPEAIDLSGADYVHYDPESGMDQSYFYPAPSEKIPSSHYMKCVLYGMGFGWMLPIDSPALLLFTTGEVSPDAWTKDDANTVYPEGLEDDEMFLFKKLKRSWCLDAVEVFDIDHADEDIKRLTPDLDGGYVYHTYQKGYAVYRNVDQEATEALPGNKEKLVYGYAYGTEGQELGSTDRSGIDAEASIRNGARIIYLDTNNSSNDFHLRKQPSLKDR